MVKDKMRTYDIGLKGLVTVELFDAKTGKLESKVQKENFIAVGNKKLWAMLQRNSIIDKMPDSLKNPVLNNESFVADANNYFNRIVLMDNSNPEEPEKEKVYIGNVIGQVDIRGITTSTNETAGVLNINESYVDREKIHIVGDFSTDKGNGTFQSIGFIGTISNYGTYSETISTNLGFSEILEGKGEGTSVNLITKIQNKLYYIKLIGSSISNRQVYEFDLDNPDLGLVGSFVIGGSRPYTGLTNDGEKLWIARNNHQIIEVNWDGTTGTILNTEIPTIQGIYFDMDEEVFYVTSSSSANNPINEPWDLCLYKIKKDNGETLEIFPFIYRNANYKVSTRLHDGTFVFAILSINNSSINFQNFTKNHAGIYGTFPINQNKSSLCNDGNDDFYQIHFSSITDYRVVKQHLSAMNSRVLLPSPQVKNNTQTMKVTYELYYTDWTKL